MNQKFKVGDKVYCLDRQQYGKVTKLYDYDTERPIRVDFERGAGTFDVYGFECTANEPRLLKLSN